MKALAVLLVVVDITGIHGLGDGAPDDVCKQDVSDAYAPQHDKYVPQPSGDKYVLRITDENGMDVLLNDVVVAKNYSVKIEANTGSKIKGFLLTAEYPNRKKAGHLEPATNASCIRSNACGWTHSKRLSPDCPLTFRWFASCVLPDPVIFRKESASSDASNSTPCCLLPSLLPCRAEYGVGRSLKLVIVSLVFANSPNLLTGLNHVEI